jgi:putative DNA primase/helicase
MSHSSAEVTYRLTGPGHRARTARVDLTRIPDPETWLKNRLGPLACFTLIRCGSTARGAPDPSSAARLAAMTSRLTSSMQVVIAKRRAALDALAARLEAAAPTSICKTANPTKEK